MPLARISLTLSHHFSLSFIAACRSSGLPPVSSYSCWMYVRAGRPAFAWLYVGVLWSTSLMISSLLLQQCPACLVRLTWIVFVIRGRWLYRLCLVGCCGQDLLNNCYLRRLSRRNSYCNRKCYQQLQFKSKMWLFVFHLTLIAFEKEWMRLF